MDDESQNLVDFLKHAEAEMAKQLQQNIRSHAFDSKILKYIIVNPKYLKTYFYIVLHGHHGHIGQSFDFLVHQSDTGLYVALVSK